MLKKRIIFTLLYQDGSFCLSRNFRLQKVGNLNWIKKNYDFSIIARSIDELIILNVSREKNSISNFCKVSALTKDIKRNKNVTIFINILLISTCFIYLKYLILNEHNPLNYIFVLCFLALFSYIFEILLNL